MAEPFRSFTSAVIPLPADNVDTDQIVPARYLKATTKDGLRDALFHDWRYDEEGAAVRDGPGGDARPEDPPRRR